MTHSMQNIHIPASVEKVIDKVKEIPTKNAMLSTISREITFVGATYFIAWTALSFCYHENLLAMFRMTGGTKYVFSIGLMQMLIGSVWGSMLWVLPDARPTPRLTKDDVIDLIPAGLATVGMILSSIFAYSSGAIAVVHMLKAAEPIVSVGISKLLFNRSTSVPKLASLAVISIGTAVAVVAHNGDQNIFSTITASNATCCLIYCLCSSYRSHELKLRMGSSDLFNRMAGIGNYFLTTFLIGTVFSLACMLFIEGDRFNGFVRLLIGNSSFSRSTFISGVCLSAFNEFAFNILARTSAATFSVANVLRCIFIIMGVCAAGLDHMTPLKTVGCLTALSGAAMYVKYNKDLTNVENQDVSKAINKQD